MESRARKVVSLALLAMLVLAAVGSLAGAGALVLERRGIVVLRRVPSPILMSWRDERGAAVAIVNTDTIPGAFLLGIHVERRLHAPSEISFNFGFVESHNEPRNGDEEHVWVPPRSIVLRRDPRLTELDCKIRLFDARASVGWLEMDMFERAVPQGAPVALEWRHYGDGIWDGGALPNSFYIAEMWCRRQGIHVIPRTSVAFAETMNGDVGYAAEDIYRWDGKTPVVIEVEPTPLSIHKVSVVACNDRGSVGDSFLWAYPPDMTIIDERGPSEAGKPR